MRRAPLAIALALVGCALHSTGASAQTLPIPVSSFNLSASPNPVGYGFSTTFTAVVGGSQAVPDGSVDFYISSSATACSTNTDDLGTVALDITGTATLVYYPGAGNFPICANYIPGGSGIYQPAQAGVYALTVYQPTDFSVSVPGAELPGTPLTFTFAVSTPSGQTPPTGTITLEDPNNSYAVLGTATVDSSGNVSGPITTTLSGNSWYAIYSGDTNYSAQYLSGQILIENSLSSVTPGAIAAGSPDTNVTLTGLGFDGTSVPEIFLGDVNATLPVNSFTSTQIQTTIPASYLATAGTISLEVVTGTTTGGPIQLQVYTPYTVTPSVSATPNSFAYGSTALTTFAASVLRGASTDAAVPAGQVSFTLAPTGGGANTSLGSAQLSQVSTPGTYSTGALQLIDTNGTGKLISADLNGDGYTDVVGLPTTYYGNGATSPYLQVWLSTGANAFQTEQQLYVGCTPQDFAVGDINGDGIPDIVVICTANYNSSGGGALQANYLLGNGDGTFQAPVAFGSNSLVTSPTHVVLGDFDGDGNMDVAVIDGVNGFLQVLFGTSPFGSFNLGPAVYFDTTYGTIVAAGAADFNQDGKSDLALEEYSYGNGAVLSLISQGLYGFTQQSETPFAASANSMQSMAITDVNGDGFPDVVVADPGQTGGSDTGNLFIFENDQAGNLPLTLDDPVAAPGAVAGPPFPVIGQPPSTAAAAPGWNLVYTSTPNGFNSDYFVTELQRQDAATWNVVNTTDTGLLVLQTEGGVVPDFVVTGDMNGDGYLDFALNGLDASSNYQLQPSYYGNDAQASLTNSGAMPVPGTYNLNLSYPGNQLYQANNTATAPVTIVTATPSGSVSGPANSNYGDLVTFTADVQGVAGGALPTGTVTFLDSANPLQTVGLTPGEGLSSATLQISTLTAGLHIIYVTYSGDSNYSATSYFAYLEIQVAGTPVTLSLTSSTTSTTAGAMVTFQAQGSGVTLPAGEQITLTGLPTSANVTPTINASGVATFNYGLFAPGTYTIQASYPGDTQFASAASNTISLNVSATPVSLTLASTANPVTYPTAIGLTAQVTSGGLGVPTGSIAFENNGTSIASGPLATVNGVSGFVSAGSYPNAGVTDIAVVTGDFNHDGIPDIAALQISDGGASLVIMLGNGDGTFQAPVVYGSAAGIDANSVALAAADFNGDGYTDLVIVASDGVVTTFMATGDAAGDMALGQQFETPTAAAVATGDFQHTGHQGFVVVGGSSIAVWYGTGGAFGSAPSWSTSTETGNYVGVAVGDFDNNGYADFAVSDANGNDAAVYLYVPTGGVFNGPQTYAVGASAGAIAAGDINGDGYSDLAVVSPSDSTVAILINNGSGGFPTVSTYGVSSGPSAVAIGDFNRDGYADVAVTGSTAAAGEGTSILLGSATGAMTGETSLPNNPGQSIASADLNNDGNPDLVVGGTSITAFLDSTSQAAASGIALTAGTAPLTAAYTPSVGSTFASGSSSTLSEVVNAASSGVLWSSPASIVYGTALSATQLDATAAVPGTFNYTPALGTVLPAGTQTLSVSFAPTDNVDYLPGTACVQISVTQASTSVTWSNPASIVYGTALGATQLNATASVPRTFAYSPAAGTVLTAGTHTLSVTFTPTDTTDYQPSTGTVSIVVGQATPGITWGTPAAITYGTALSATQLNATASVPGTLAYSPASGTVLTAGTHTLSVTFTPTDTTDYTAATASVSLVVNQAASVITWSNPASIVYGTALSGTQLNATASNPGTFNYSPAGGTILTAGTHTLSVAFSPTDTTDYRPNTAQVSIVVTQATPTITWSAPGAITYGTALSATQLNATASVPGTLAFNPAAGTVLTAGTHTLSVTFTPTDTTDYTTATGSVSIVVNQATPAITWATPAAVTYGTALGATQLNATASVPGTLAFNPPAGTVLTAGTHTLSVTFTPTDTTDYTTATGSVSIVVNQATPAITWATPAAITYGTALGAAQLSATHTVAGTLAYTPAAGTVLTAGTHTLSVTLTPTDTTDYTTATATVSIIVNQGAPTITWTAPGAITYGTALSATQLSATASVPGTLAYTPAAGTVLTAGTHTLSVTFTPTDTTDYTTATSSVSIVVNQATSTVSWTAPAAITYGTALSATQLNATASVPGTLAYNPASGTVLTAGTHTLSVTFTPTDTTDYTTATSSVTIVVNQATPVVTWATPAPIVAGTALSATQLNATAAPTGGTFAYTPPAGTVLAVGSQTLSVVYTPADTTDYTTASATVTIVVNPNLVLTSISPSSAPINSPATTITLAGSGFTSTSTVQLNGAVIPSTYVSPTQMTATLPATFFAQAGTGAITVTNAQAGLTSLALDFTVAPATVQVQLSGPSSVTPGEQPAINFTLLQPYPLDLQGTFTLSVQPATPGGPVDPAVQFSTGGDTLTFTIPANSVTTPTVQIQAGTLAATITITLDLQANGQDVTPASLQPVVITVPSSAPVITSVALTRSGSTLTVTVQGFSSTRDVSKATFFFAPSAGSSVANPSVTVDVSSAFSTWYSSAASQQYGSAFSYTQTFDLSNDASTIGSVTVTLTNSAGISNSRSAN